MITVAVQRECKSDQKKCVRMRARELMVFSHISAVAKYGHSSASIMHVLLAVKA